MAMAEKEAESGINELSPSESRQQHKRVGGHIRKLFHPSGKRIHVAANPDQEYRLRQSLAKIEPDENFVIYVHGSEEHLQAIREIHAHHEQEQANLRAKNADLYTLFEDCRAELDELSHELSSLTDQGVSLDANFSKFGYDAHIRTREPGSSANSISGASTGSGGMRDWDAEIRNGQAYKFVRKPVVRQYFHKGIIWRAAEAEEVGAFELFVDLLYVGIIAIIGDAAAEDANGYNLDRFAITFIIAYKMWNDITVIVGWFEVQDIFTRLCVVFNIVFLFGYTLNIVNAFETTWIQMISFYLASRFFGACYFLSMGLILPMIRGHMWTTALMIFIPGALWIASIQLEYPARLALVWPAIFLDTFGNMVVISIKHYVESSNEDDPKPLACILVRYFDFIPAINIEHRTERTNSLITLVFGYSVVALFYQNQASFGINAFFGKAILGLLQAFAFNWLYFEIDSWNLHTHAIRRHASTALLWNAAHIPFIMGYILASATLSRLVLATDCNDADPKTLNPLSAAKAEADLSDGLVWYYCGGLGIALLGMTAISLSHVHKEFHGQRLRKKIRLPFRILVSIILLLLPVIGGNALHTSSSHGEAGPESGNGLLARAEDMLEPSGRRLNSLQLIAVTTSLIVMVLAVDVYGNTDRNGTFWFCRAGCNKYSTDCNMSKRRKAMLLDAIKKGAKVDMKDFKGENGLESGHDEDSAWDKGLL